MAVEYKFCRREVIHPVILSGVSKQTQVSFDFLVCAFSLPVRLRMIRGSQRVDDPKFLIQGFGEACGELRTPIGYDLGWDSVKAEYLAVMDIHDPLRINVRRGW
jgi:hypothetical protein